jgi:DNA modification methylase
LKQLPDKCVDLVLTDPPYGIGEAAGKNKSRGSGSTGKAAVLEGFRFLGFEREAEYAEIANKRIESAEASKDALLV